MNKNLRTFIKILHLLFACLWLGASASIVLLQCLRGWSENSQELAALNLDFSILDFALIIPGALGSLLTGFWICKTTNWGFTRYRWVIAKWIGTLSGILVGSALLGPWQIQMVRLSSQPEDALVNGYSYGLIRTLFTLVGSLQVLLLVFIVAVSVLKPWGKRLSRQKEVGTLERRRYGDTLTDNTNLSFCTNQSPGWRDSRSGNFFTPRHLTHLVTEVSTNFYQSSSIIQVKVHEENKKGV